MSHVYSDACSRNFPEDTPFVLQGNPAAQRWAQTVHEVNSTINRRFPNQWITIFMALLPMTVGLGLNLYFLLVWNNLTWALTSLFIGMGLWIVYIIISLVRVNAAIRSINEYLRQENTTFYNAHGVNIHFVRGSKYQRQRLEIEIRGQPAPGFNAFAVPQGFSAVPQQGVYNQGQQPNMYNQGQQGGYFSGGQPVYSAPQYSNSTNNFKQ
eukprot:TRINITY_DN2648_c0_g2_i1.p1 TRINITY_DN2648_c0_g2~~TRINITY_DN2648_c0_g2_i1.p1  ORF type:complete len:210 (-),score=49.14 TRINITY_DN2648_c0_g2_i1:690-1319(-)